MDDGGEMGVVEVEAMQQHAVYEGCIPERQPLAMPDHRARAFAAERGCAGQRALGKWKAAGCEPHADGIENEQARALAHGPWHIGKPHARYELGKTSGGDGRGIRPGARIGKGAIAWG